MADVTPVSSRRRWLLGTLLSAIGATLVAIFYPVFRFLKPRRATVSGALEVVAPFKLKDLAQTTGNPFDFAGKPCLVVLTAEGSQRLAQGEPLQTDDIKAFNAVCTHVECTVAWRKDEGDIFCACHDGVYDLNGHNVSGPPPRPLETYKVALRGEPGEEEIVVSRES
jgi:Rieske Fe-S protein